MMPSQNMRGLGAGGVCENFSPWIFAFGAVFGFWFWNIVSSFFLVFFILTGLMKKSRKY
jgi:hypothetical protein